MTIQTIPIANDTLVVLARRDFEALMERAGLMPRRPRPDRRGNVDAKEAINASIARSLVKDRIGRGWTQTQLAKKAGVRLETISRIESGNTSRVKRR